MDAAAGKTKRTSEYLRQRIAELAVSAENGIDDEPINESPASKRLITATAGPPVNLFPPRSVLKSLRLPSSSPDRRVHSVSFASGTKGDDLPSLDTQRHDFDPNYLPDDSDDNSSANEDAEVQRPNTTFHGSAAGDEVDVNDDDDLFDWLAPAADVHGQYASKRSADDSDDDDEDDENEIDLTESEFSDSVDKTDADENYENELLATTLNLQNTMLFESSSVSVPTVATVVEATRDSPLPAESDAIAAATTKSRRSGNSTKPSLPRELYNRMIGDIMGCMLEQGETNELLAQAEQKVRAMLRDWPQASQLYYIMACLFSDAGDYARAYHWIKMGLFVRPFSAMLSDKALAIAQDINESLQSNVLLGENEYTELLRIAYRNNRKDPNLAILFARNCIQRHRLKFARFILERTVRAYQEKITNQRKQQVLPSMAPAEYADDSNRIFHNAQYAAVYEQLGNLLLLLDEPELARTNVEEAIGIVQQSSSSGGGEVAADTPCISQDLFISWCSTLALTGDHELALRTLRELEFIIMQSDSDQMDVPDDAEQPKTSTDSVVVINSEQFNFTSEQMASLLLVLVGNDLLASLVPADKLSTVCRTMVTTNTIRYYKIVARRCEQHGLFDAAREIYESVVKVCGTDMEVLHGKVTNAYVEAKNEVLNAAEKSVEKSAGSDPVVEQSRSTTPEVPLTSALLQRVSSPYLHLWLFDTIFNLAECYECTGEHAVAVQTLLSTYKAISVLRRAGPSALTSLRTSSGVMSGMDLANIGKKLIECRARFASRLRHFNVPLTRGSSARAHVRIGAIAASALFFKYDIREAWKHVQSFMAEYHEATKVDADSSIADDNDAEQNRLKMSKIRQFCRKKQQKPVASAGDGPNVNEFQQFLISAERVICHHLPAYVVEDLDMLRLATLSGNVSVDGGAERELANASARSSSGTGLLPQQQNLRTKTQPMMLNGSNNNNTDRTAEAAGVLRRSKHRNRLSPKKRIEESEAETPNSITTGHILSRLTTTRHNKFAMHAVNDQIFTGDEYWQFVLAACDLATRFSSWHRLFRWAFAASYAPVVYGDRARITCARLLQALAAGQLQLYAFLRTLFRCYIFKQSFASPMTYCFYTQLQRYAQHRSNDWRFERQFGRVYCEMRAAMLNFALRYMVSGHYAEALVYLTKLIDQQPDDLICIFYNAVVWTAVSSSSKLMQRARAEAFFMANYYWHKFLHAKAEMNDALYDMANFYSSLGNYELAREYYQKTLQWRIDADAQGLLFCAEADAGDDEDEQAELRQHFRRLHDVGCEALHNWCATYIVVAHEWPNLAAPAFLATQDEPQWQRHSRLLQWKYREYSRPYFSNNTLRRAQAEVLEGKRLREKIR